MEDCDASQVWGTCREGFVALTGWTHLEDGNNNKYIKHENDEQCADPFKSGKNEKQQLVVVSIRVRERQQWGDFTEEMIVLKHQNDIFLS